MNVALSPLNAEDLKVYACLQCRSNLKAIADNLVCGNCGNMDLPLPARTQIPSCFVSELSFRLPCPSLTRQAQKEFGVPCRGERGCNSWPLFLTHSPASDFYSTWLIQRPAGPHTYFFWFSWVVR